MNIFTLNQNPRECARDHCDKHVVKMILESSQMLSTTITILDPEFTTKHKHALLKSTHQNHPCTIWTRESFNNFMWHLDLLTALHEEYESRYWRVHNCVYQLNTIYNWVSNQNTCEKFPVTNATRFAMAIPDDKIKHKYTDLLTGLRPDASIMDQNSIIIAAYREYYMIHKSRFARWNHSEVPSWYSIPSN
jgi:hypothetical protein